MREETLEVIVIGAGQAGLAMGYFLAQQGQRFVILDGTPAIGHVWRQRYDSLVLFTPAAYSSLPGLPFPAPPDHYPTKDEVADYLRRYAERYRLPVRLNTPVRAVRPTQEGYEVLTDEIAYRARQVVIATGPFQRPHVPALAAGLDPSVFQIHSAAYRGPDQLPPGDVLIVGAGNSGVQIAAELSASRKVYLSEGSSAVYLPQRLLGRSLFWWFERLRLADLPLPGRLGQRLRRMEPVIGTDVRWLERQRGVERLGRTLAAEGRTLRFSGGRTLAVSTILWATGFRPDYGWIEAPVFDPQGRPIHRRGVTAAPGLYFLGLPWLHRWNSAVLGGVGHDAAFLAEQIARHALPTAEYTLHRKDERS